MNTETTREALWAAIDAYDIPTAVIQNALAKHEAAVRAEALREAANWIAAEFDLDCDDVQPYNEHQSYMEDAHRYDMGQLRKRAARIEKEAQA